MLQDIVESLSAADSVSELSVIQLSDSALSGGVPPTSISTGFNDLSRLVLALGVSGDGGSGVWNVHLLGPIIRGVWCTPDIGVGCDCRGSCNCCGVYLIWLCGCGVSILRHLRIMAGVHTSTSHSGEAMTSGLRTPTGRCGVACGVCGIRQGVGGFSSSGGGGSSSSPQTDTSPSNSSRSSSSSSCLGSLIFSRKAMVIFSCPGLPVGPLFHYPGFLCVMGCAST